MKTTRTEITIHTETVVYVRRGGRADCDRGRQMTMWQRAVAWLRGNTRLIARRES